MTTKTIVSLLLITLCTCATSCHRYSISLNDQVLHEPAGLFRDFKVADKNLHNCIKDTIQNLRLTKAEQLTKLLCPSNNIYSVAGIEKFLWLKVLGLKSNQLSDISSIAELKQLEQLDLSNNKISNALPINGLIKLKLLKLENNPSLDCKSIKPSNASTEIIRPKHCHE